MLYFTRCRALATHAEVLASGRAADRAAVVLAGGGSLLDAVSDLVEQCRWQAALVAAARAKLSPVQLRAVAEQCAQVIVAGCFCPSNLQPLTFA
jgi:hypothetical protein